MSTAMKDRALYYFLEKDRNCAESVYLAAADVLGLPAAETTVRAIGAFGGGMGCGESCGALCGAVAALGSLLIDEHGAHACPDAHQAAADMTARFRETFGMLRCADLKPRFATPDRRCADLVARTAALLEPLCTR